MYKSQTKTKAQWYMALTQKILLSSLRKKITVFNKYWGGTNKQGLQSKTSVPYAKKHAQLNGFESLKRQYLLVHKIYH